MRGALCVDLSEYQKGISFAALKAQGVQAVILRGGDGTYEDNCFGEFYDQAKAQGLPVGAYWYSRAESEIQARIEAEWFYAACLKGRRFELPIFLDCESEAQGKLGAEGLTEVILAGWPNGALTGRSCPTDCGSSVGRRTISGTERSRAMWWTRTTW